MSEITDDYINDPNVHRWTTTANGAKLTVTSNTTSYAWTVTVFPDEMIDSDNPSAEASGAPTLRAALDTDGVNQIPLKVVDFTPASGGIGGGATAEIKINVGTYADGVDLPVTFFWITGGSQTQPAAGETYGSDEAMAGTVFWSADGGLTDISPTHSTQTDTATADETTTVKLGLHARNYDAATDRMVTQVDMDDATTGWTWMIWGRRNTGTGTSTAIGQMTGTTGCRLYSVNGDMRVDVNATLPFNITGGWTLNTYIHVALTYNSTTGYVIYVGGASAGTNPTTTFPTFSTPTSLEIGSKQAVSNGWRGQLDEPIVIKTTLDAGQISTLFENQSSPSTFWDATAEVEDGPFTASTGNSRLNMLLEVSNTRSS